MVPSILNPRTMMFVNTKVAMIYLLITLFLFFLVLSSCSTYWDSLLVAVSKDVSCLSQLYLVPILGDCPGYLGDSVARGDPGVVMMGVLLGRVRVKVGALIGSGGGGGESLPLLNLNPSLESWPLWFAYTTSALTWADSMFLTSRSLFSISLSICRSLFSISLKSFVMFIDCVLSGASVVSRVCVKQVYPECPQEHHPLTPLTLGLELSLLSDTPLSVLIPQCSILTEKTM